jgi:membrane protein
VIEWFKRLSEKPPVAHLMRAGERFLGRLGFQFSAAITYFSVLALVPTVMMAFSFTGFFLVQLRPDLIPGLADLLTAQLRGIDQDTVSQVEKFIVDTLSDYTAIGVVGFLAAIYAGAGWMNNLRDALNAQWRPEFDQTGPPPNPIVRTLTSLLALVGLLVAILITFGLASISTSLTDQVIGWLGLPPNPVLAAVLALVPVVFSIGAGWLTFSYVYLVLPERREAWRIVRQGALMGAVGLAVLQYLASFLIGRVFSSTLSARFFGPIIVLMLFFNLFATLILFIAAWIATAESPAFIETDEKVRFAVAPADPEADDATGDDKVVPEQVAVRSIRIGTGAGYVTGAATGVGIGAIVAFLAARLGRRR